MTEDFNIKDNNWDPLYPHHSTHTDILRKIVDSFNLELSTSINQVSTQYINNPNNTHLVINLMFLWANSEEFKNYSILSDLRSLSDYTFLMVNMIINEEFIQDNHHTIIKNSKEWEIFIKKLKNEIGNINTINISNRESLKRVIQEFTLISSSP